MFHTVAGSGEGCLKGKWALSSSHGGLRLLTASAVRIRVDEADLQLLEAVWRWQLGLITFQSVKPEVRTLDGLVEGNRREGVLCRAAPSSSRAELYRVSCQATARAEVV